MVFFAELTLPGTHPCDVISSAIFNSLGDNMIDIFPVLNCGSPLLCLELKVMYVVLSHWAVAGKVL